MNSIAFIGVGANLGPKLETIKTAYQLLRQSAEVQNFESSSIYETPPMGPKQPHYLNSVACFNYTSTAQDLLALLQSIENAAGRDRSSGIVWGPRTLDLDILLFGNEKHNTSTLQIPHPGLMERAFVIMPLAELKPSLMLNHISAQDLAQQLDDPEIKKTFSPNGAPYEYHN